MVSMELLYGQGTYRSGLESKKKDGFHFHHIGHGWQRGPKRGRNQHVANVRYRAQHAAPQREVNTRSTEIHETNYWTVIVTLLLLLV
jgi:hypothetical protein